MRKVKECQVTAPPMWRANELLIPATLGDSQFNVHSYYDTPTDGLSMEIGLKGVLMI